MKSLKTFTEQDKETIIRLHNDGKYNREIADAIGASLSSISRFLQSTDLPSRHSMLTDERVEIIKDTYLRIMNIKETCKIAKCGGDTVRKIIKEYGLPKLSMSDACKKYDIDDGYFVSIDTKNKAYYLGLIYADGTVSSNKNSFSISLQQQDSYILESMSHDFAGNRPLYVLKHDNPDWQDTYILSITNERFRKNLINAGVVPNKTYLGQFPRVVPDNLLNHFVRGYFDGNGSINKSECRITIVSTLAFCDKLSDILADKLCVHCSVFLCHRDTESPVRTLQIAGRNQVKKFLDWMYFDANLFLKRKYNIYRKIYYSNDFTDNSPRD